MKGMNDNDASNNRFINNDRSRNNSLWCKNNEK